MKQTLLLVTIVALFLIVGCGYSDTTTTEQDESLKDVAHDAFIYAYWWSTSAGPAILGATGARPRSRWIAILPPGVRPTRRSG